MLLRGQARASGTKGQCNGFGPSVLCDARAFSEMKNAKQSKVG